MLGAWRGLGSIRRRDAISCRASRVVPTPTDPQHRRYPTADKGLFLLESEGPLMGRRAGVKMGGGWPVTSIPPLGGVPVLESDAGVDLVGRALLLRARRLDCRSAY